MARCQACNKEMTTAAGCIFDEVLLRPNAVAEPSFSDPALVDVEDSDEWLRRYDERRVIDTSVEPKLLKRGRVGADGGVVHLDGRCADCGARRGYVHHTGCDMERCPGCGQQALGCSNCHIADYEASATLRRAGDGKRVLILAYGYTAEECEAMAHEREREQNRAGLEEYLKTTRAKLTAAKKLNAPRAISMLTERVDAAQEKLETLR